MLLYGRRSVTAGKLPSQPVIYDSR